MAQKFSMKKCILTVIGTIIFLAASIPAVDAQVSITFDYTFDTGGFFTQSRKDILGLAAGALSGRLADSLSAINPGGVNTWDVSFDDPTTGTSQSIHNLNVTANQLIIYVGARDLPGSNLGLGGPGGFSVSGNQNFVDTVVKRGQAGETAGASATDFAPWGGSISFDSVATWYFDSDPSNQEIFTGQNDFYSVALHELGHVLGIGSADSWNNLISGGNFTGSGAMSLNGGQGVPVEADGGHWKDNNLTSTIPGTLTLQELAMDPSLTVGTRKHFTDLDFAGLNDLGWQVTPVPEPVEYATTAAFFLLGFVFLRRQLKPLAHSA